MDKRRLMSILSDYKAGHNHINKTVDLIQKLELSESDYAKYEMYQCPYEKACHCKMDEPCKGCETWAKYFATKEQL